MRLKSRLNHTCTVQLKGTEQTGEDDYGRPIYGNPDPIENVPCRFEKGVTTTVDENGTNYNDTIRMMFMPDSGIESTTIVTNVKDAEGNLLYDDQLEVEFVSLAMGRRTVAHIEADMKEV